MSVGASFAALLGGRGSALFSLLSSEFRRLQRHLWLARRRDRPDDVAVAYLDRVLVGAELNSEIEHQTARDNEVAGNRLAPAAP